jgi:hypothetical protein
MIDILLVLLVFFMAISSTEVLQTNDHVQLPVAKEGKERRRESRMGCSSSTSFGARSTTSARSMWKGNRLPSPAKIVPILQHTVQGDAPIAVSRFARTRMCATTICAACLKAAATPGCEQRHFSVVDKEGTQVSSN